MKDADARAQEICATHIRTPWSTDDYHLRDAIAAALRAEREQTLNRVADECGWHLSDTGDRARFLRIIAKLKDKP